MSYNCGGSKGDPEEKFVKCMIEMSDCKANEIIWFDDYKSYSEHAKNLNVNFVLYKSGDKESLREQLKQYNLDNLIE